MRRPCSLPGSAVAAAVLAGRSRPSVPPAHRLTVSQERRDQLRGVLEPLCEGPVEDEVLSEVASNLLRFCLLLDRWDRQARELASQEAEGLNPREDQP